MGVDENINGLNKQISKSEQDISELVNTRLSTLNSKLLHKEVMIHIASCAPTKKKVTDKPLLKSSTDIFLCNKRRASCEIGQKILKHQKSKDISIRDRTIPEQQKNYCLRESYSYLFDLSTNYLKNNDLSSKNQTDHAKLFNRISNDKDENGMSHCNLGKSTDLKDLRVNIQKIDENNYKLKTMSIENNIYEVEQVLKKKIKNSSIFYLIKWKNWGFQYNTWEPAENLTNCSELLKDFEDERVKLLERFQKAIDFYPNITDLEKKMRDLIQNGTDINSLADNTDDIYDEIDFSFENGTIKCKKNMEKLKSNILSYFIYNARAEQLASLEDWENEMNSITIGKPVIKVENTIDLEKAPQEFLYIDDYLPGLGVIIPDEPPIGCECSECDSKTKCCYAMCEGSLPYTSACRIRVSPGTPIYECNKRCKCSINCQNRVVQRGSNMKLCVFRTPNGRGWGVKTLRSIKKGTFVIQYVGEVITNEEAEKRGKEYDAAGRTYLFDLDYNDTEEQCPYTVDAATYGNISHFINHSCDPNLAVYAVWINCLDPNLPKLALFATKDIRQNEEITFDYMCQSTKDDLLRQRLDLPGNTKKNESTEARVRCKCGSIGCRQYLF